MLTIDDISIDDEFKNLIPPLTAEERTGLMVSLERDGYRDALVTWNGILLDGHNRFEIWEQNHAGTDKTPPDVLDMKFSSRDEAESWLIKNQLSRRNLNDFQRTELNLRLEKLLIPKAKESKKRKPNSVKENSPSQKYQQTRDIIGEASGVSGNTVQKVKKIVNEGSPELVQQAREGKISINAAHKKLPREEKEVSKTKTNKAPKSSVTESIGKTLIQIKNTRISIGLDVLSKKWSEYQRNRIVSSLKNLKEEIDLWLQEISGQ